MYPIPANATRIRYVQANGIAYIDTGVPVSMDYSVKCVGEVVSYGARSNVGLFGFWVRINSVEHTQRVFPSINSSAYGVRAQTTGASISTLLFSGANPYEKHSVECNRGTITVDGVSQTGNWSSWNDSNYTQHLFGIKQINPVEQVPGEHDQQDANTVIRIYSASWEDGNGNLVRDFVPCRVGQTPYMFDRVTGTLFEKQGEGTFTAGPDTFQQGVVPTRMCVMGVRKKAGPTSLDYVQDGLYYQLDGIENAGRGIHSATATTWTDLTGNGRDATFLNAASGLVWQDNAAYLYGKTHDGIAKIRGLPSMTAFTFEFVSRMDAKDDYARMYDSEAYGVGAKRFASLFGTAAYPLAMSFLLANNDDQNYNLIPVSTSARSCAVTPNVSGSSYSARVCVNGVFVQSGAAKSASGVSAATYIDVANRSNTPNRGFDGAVYAIRVYNRVLTASEIAANYAIDKARFNLP